MSNMRPEMGIERHLSFNATFVAFVARRGAFVANVSLTILAHGRFCVQGRSLSETWKAETMPNAVSNEFKHSLLHFHVCVHCGSAFRREEFGGRAVTSGILPCTKCGAEGPLNIEVRETDKPDSETQAFATK